jgi:superfamily II DNA or RNA helicase
MEIVLSNKVRVKNPPESLIPYIAEKLTVPNPKFEEAVNAGRSTYKIDPSIVNFTYFPDGSIIMPRGIEEWLYDTSDSLKIKYKIFNERTIFPHKQICSSKIEYRPYQFEAVVELSGKNQGVLVAPAGSGKTVMGLSMIPMLGQPTLWLTHTGPLAEQTTQRAQTFLPDVGEVGLIGRGKWQTGEVLTVGMVQTLFRNMDEIIKLRDQFGMVIFDECHRLPARTFMEVAGAFNSFYMYGLTATPYRRDKLETLMFHAISESTTTIPLDKVSEHGGIMIPTVVYKEINSKRVDDNNIQTILSKYIVDNPKRNRVIAGDVLREAVKGHYCIIISDRREHCERLHQLISAGWPKTGIATGKYSKKYVAEQVEAFNKGDITVLVATYALMGEGFDVPFLDRAFIAMPFRAEAKAEQLIGRIQRTFPGKTDAIVYDYVDVDIGVLKNQFYNKRSTCRHRTYSKLGIVVRPS